MKDDITRRGERTALGLLFFLSGFTGLVYQVLWVRRFTHVMGSGSVSVSVVIAAFMGGLFVGAVLLTQALPRCRNELRWYASLEAVIGAWGLLFVWAFPHGAGLYAWLAASGAALTAKSVYSALWMLVPAAAMGATLPLMVQYVERRGRGFSDTVGLLYAVNAAGGAVGALLAGFALIELLGIDASLLLVAAVNLAVAVVAWRLATRGDSAAVTKVAPRAALAGPALAGGGRLLLPAAAVTGFVAIGCEVLWTRGLKFIIQSSTYSYASILGTFLVGLGVGGAIYRRWLTGSDHVALIGRLQLALALWVLATVWLLYGLAPSAWFNDALLSPVYEGDHHWSFGVGLFGLVCAVVLVPPTTAMGVSFPALSTLFHRHASESAGRCVCAVFASNTIGSIAGALVVGFGLLPWLGIRGSLVLMAAL